MTTIKLPPLPEYDLAHEISGYKYGHTDSQLRARDLEVARVVLEAAAGACEQYQGSPERTAEIIRALEIVS